MEVNGADDPCLFAYLSKGGLTAEMGKVIINNLTDERSLSIPAHDSQISCMRFNFKGNYFATASKKVSGRAMTQGDDHPHLRIRQRGPHPRAASRDRVQRDLGHRLQLLRLDAGVRVGHEDDPRVEAGVGGGTNGSWDSQSKKTNKPSIFNTIFSKISPYANADRNITNAKTNIVNKMFILFDDSNNVKLFSNKGEYEMHFFDSQTNSINFVKYQKCVISYEAKLQTGSEMDLFEDEETEQNRFQQQLRLYGSESFHGTGSQHTSDNK